MGGDYGAYEVLNCATKFFVDALMRHEAIETKRLGAPSTLSVLAWETAAWHDCDEASPLRHSVAAAP